VDGLNTRALIIDDNPAIHEDMRKILISDRGYEELQELEVCLFGEERKSAHPQYRIDSAFQGKEGLAKVREALSVGDPYAVAFVDVRMPPGWDGIETLEHIWHDYPELQVVLCTAYSDHSWADIISRLGETDNLLILKKPFDPIELHQMANALSRKWALQREDREKLRQTNAQLEARLRELQETQSQLVMAEKLAAVGQLASGLAHEINTPIQFVGDNVLFLQKALAQLFQGFDSIGELLNSLPKELVLGANQKLSSIHQKMKLEYLKEDMPAAVLQSIDGLERVASIVRAMQEFAHPSQGKKSLVDLRGAIESTLTISKSVWKNVAEIETDYEVGTESVFCFRDELNQVILNLLVNAAHAISDANEKTCEMGKITIQTHNEEEWTEIKISDTGIGIPPEIRHRVFEPFFTTKEVGKGTGQGLAIAYAMIVDKHNGQLNFTSELGKGTTFTIRLPRKQNEETLGQGKEQI
jgi:two-component system NtrC family sensor kinase